MSIVKFENIAWDCWYNITLYADHCKAYGRTHTEHFEARFNGKMWVDIKGKEYSVYAVFSIDDELAF